MLSVAGRYRLRESGTGWYLLISGFLHLLAVVVLNLLLMPSDVSRIPKESPPLRVSFIHPVAAEEPQKAEVFAETSSRAQMPDGPQAEGAQATETILPAERLAPADPSPAPPGHVSEEPQRPALRPPAVVTPPSPPQGTPKRATAPSWPEATAKHRLPTPGQLQGALQGRPKLQRFARLPEPAERVPLPSAPRHREPQDHSAGADAPEAEPRQGWLHGRIPLLSGDDLDKYAKLRSSEQRSSGGNAVSLNTKELKYISYFAHIKLKIEGVWGYPPEAIANEVQGKLLLKFVLQRNGQVKTVDLLRSSGHKVLDKEAWDAVVNAGPFDPFPSLIQDDELHITASFTYELDTTQRRTMVR